MGLFPWYRWEAGGQRSIVVDKPLPCIERYVGRGDYHERSV